MRGEFQRLLMMSEPEILPLNAQAAMGPVRPKQRGQFEHLYRHFLERFFNHETASPDGDAKTRMVQVAFVAGLPGFVVALYLFPVYHPLGWPLGSPTTGPPYWVQVSHHFFFVMYAFVSMGLATVFEWDMFFPDLLDVLVLGALPVPQMRLFRARIAAIGLFVGAFLFDANFLAPLVLPASTEPPDLARFLAGHLAAVALAGLFAAAFVLALQGVLIAVFGERWFRRASLGLQGLAIAALLVLLLLFPVFSVVVPAVLESGGAAALCFPPFWFLGVYQRLLEGPAALPVYHELAKIGVVATLVTALAAIVSYPIAYLRKVGQLIVGPGAHSTRIPVFLPLNTLLHATFLRSPVRRAVAHFIGQTILRVPRYRIYLVMYGGVGLSVVVAALLRFAVVRGHVRFAVSADGIRVAAAIVAFWMIAGLRMTFVSPGNQRGSWIFAIVHGRPAHFDAAMEEFLAAKVWVLLISGAITAFACAFLRAIAPPELQSWPSLAAQWLVAAAVCVLLTDLFFLNVTTIAFTGEAPRGQSNLAFSVLKYFTLFPLVAVLPISCEPWIESSVWHFAAAAGLILAGHLAFSARHRRVVREYCATPALEENEDDSYLKLGLRA